jgi:hypothetical protein
MDQPTEGALFSYRYGDSYVIKKVLKVDPAQAPDPELYHCIVYEPVQRVPAIGQIWKLPIHQLHALLSRLALLRDGTYLGNDRVHPEELAGYLEYLRDHHYERFLAECEPPSSE